MSSVKRIYWNRRYCLSLFVLWKIIYEFGYMTGECVRHFGENRDRDTLGLAPDLSAFGKAAKQRLYVCTAWKNCG